MRISSGFWFAFLWWLVMLNSFSYACWPSGFPLFRKCLFSPSVHFLNGFLFFDVNCMSCLYMLDIRDYSIGHITCKYFLPITRLSFHFVDDFLCSAKGFKFNYVPFVCFCFYLLWLRRRWSQNTAAVYVKEHSMISSRSPALTELTF